MLQSVVIWYGTHGEARRSRALLTIMSGLSSAPFRYFSSATTSNSSSTLLRKFLTFGSTDQSGTLTCDIARARVFTMPSIEPASHLSPCVCFRGYTYPTTPLTQIGNKDQGIRMKVSESFHLYALDPCYLLPILDLQAFCLNHRLFVIVFRLFEHPPPYPRYHRPFPRDWL